jgi:ADP-ribosylglycohydrolase
MIGAIGGDIIGSIYEARPIKTKEFPLFDPRCRFTDDTVLTLAVAKAIVGDRDYLKAVWDLGRRYPHAGYGGSFIRWLSSDQPRPYNSWGNGSAMRVSPVGFAFDNVNIILEQAKLSAAISHNHPEGIKGAQATALAVFLARTTHDKTIVRGEISAHFDYDLTRTVDGIRPDYGFDVSCQGTVPEAIICFLDSHSYEDAVRNAISLGGDSDTLACITGAIAEAFYGPVPSEIETLVRESLPPDLLEILDAFYRRYPGVQHD